MTLRPLKQRGDTIVEVMVVLAILGLAIGISYATANRSLLATHGAQENSQATEILQGQLEQLRAYANAPNSDVAHYIYRINPNYFCFDSTNNIVGFSGANIQTAAYPASCITSYYKIAITYDTAADKFTATAIWDDVSGNGVDSATLVYRVHPQ